MTLKKAVRATLATVSLLGLGILLFLVGGVDSGLYEVNLGRIFGALAMFAAPLGILALLERR